MPLLEFDAFLQELAETAMGSPDVIGLVAFGSTAVPARADEWSDHDFAWITKPGAEERYRHDLTWLPRPERIALSVVEHHGGVKVIYEDGHRLEFGIGAVDDFATWAGSPAIVIVGDEDVCAAAAEVAARRPGGVADAAAEVRLMLTQLLSGVSRARRGEHLSGAGLVLFEAVNHLLRALAARQAPDARLDPLDPRRRFELVHPHTAAAIEVACRRPIEGAAVDLLGIAEELLAPGWQAFPHAGAAAVRARLGWKAPGTSGSH